VGDSIIQKLTALGWGSEIEEIQTAKLLYGEEGLEDHKLVKQRALLTERSQLLPVPCSLILTDVIMVCATYSLEQNLRTIG